MFQHDELEEKDRRRIRRFVNLCHKYVAEYSVISTQPLILFLPVFVNLNNFTRDYGFLFDSLKKRTVYIICCTWWNFERPRNIEELDDLLRRFNHDYPNFTFTFLCNTKAQLELFAAKKFNAIFCNNNCFIDETLFFPILGAEKRFDAVYDGRLVDWKRHYLASDIKNIALIYYAIPWLEDNSHMKRITEDFSRAQFFNHNELGQYQKMTPTEVNQALNQCRVGLCVSAEEGAMYASIQYLLAGIPVVSTPSAGGRDVFFDDEIAMMVEPTPGAVKHGVAEVINRNLDPDYVRQKTLERMTEHRGRFIELVQRIYEQEGVLRNFSDEWSKIFFNKLLRNRSHLETIELLKTAAQ